MSVKSVINENGDEMWYKIDELGAVLHRDDDLPAVVNKDGSKKWYKNGVLVDKKLSKKED